MYRRREAETEHLLAGAAVTEAAGALNNLLLGDSNNVDGDGVELGSVSLSVMYSRRVNIRPSS